MPAELVPGEPSSRQSELTPHAPHEACGAMRCSQPCFLGPCVPKIHFGLCFTGLLGLTGGLVFGGLTTAGSAPTIGVAGSAGYGPLALRLYGSGGAVVGIWRP